MVMTREEHDLPTHVGPGTPAGDGARDDEAGDGAGQPGEDPVGVVRDPDHPISDTNMSASLRLKARRGALAG